jgi:hypothetical protein
MYHVKAFSKAPCKPHTPKTICGTFVELFDFSIGTNVIKNNLLNMTNCDCNVTFADVGTLK